jgi:hypothetical protein
MYSDKIAEIKRMYVIEFRKGIAQILVVLQQWAKEHHFTSCILETGKNTLKR